MDITIEFLLICFKAVKTVSPYVENYNVFYRVNKYGRAIEKAIINNNIIDVQQYLYPLKTSLNRCKIKDKKQEALFLYYMACCYYVEHKYDKSKDELLKLKTLSPIFHKNKVREIQGKGNIIWDKIKMKEKEEEREFYKKQKCKQILIWGCIIFILLICLLCIIFK